MSGLRRLFRGSGRALAFVFAASVAWLLLDMAALRLSLGDAGGRLLREAAERGWAGLGGSPRPDPSSRLPRRGGGGSPASRAAPGPPRPPPGIRGQPEQRRGARMVPPWAALGRRGGAGLGAAREAPWKARLRLPDESLAPALGVTAASRRAGHTVVEGRGHSTPGSWYRPADTAGTVSRPPATAGLGALRPEETEPGEREAPSESRFILVGKGGTEPGGPTEPRPAPSSAGNIAKSREEPQREEENDAHAASVSPRAVAQGGWTLGARNGTAQGAPSTRKQERADGIPGTHRVLAMDATLAPRDPRAPGQFGRPVAVPNGKQEEAKSRWKEGNFNVYLSDMIPVDRAIADTRPAGCSDQWVHNDLPTTTIIMCFVDEVWSTLLRSVHSVLSRSPPHLIEEIILVDDFSTKEYLKEKLDRYMSRFPKVQILRLKERHGLIRARLAGAEIAKGTVLTFLDSHVECNVGWLEPLLERVRLSRTKVACPVIEVISDKDMSYMTVDNFQRGIFTWPMNFGWRQIPQEIIEKNKIKETDVIRCPVMAGGLFSIDKKYFFELGTYDPGLDVWGGENMEISFKVWMCGGEIEIVPCSRVGHIFRNDNPYSFPKDRVRTVERNLARVAEVWLDEYKELFYGHAYHLVLKNLDVGDLTQQIQLRKKLQCKSFRWYLENIYPDLDAPLVKASGLLLNVGMARCITVENTRLALEVCDVNNKHQHFNYTWLRRIQHGELCIMPSGAAVTLRPCRASSPSTAWLHRALVAFQTQLKDHLISEHLQQPVCLEVGPSDKALRVSACDSTNPHQKWQFGSYYAD
ncbi:polypeptide N-acetylgalactosaminyltransferase 5 [Indicator indicator]|uniref:polypeptide N-acetylgalactosaminyltransferase 5 n=1 Tax=Indicator indicator TaxID=1002788 RepID=UPI0023DE9244|nr:polypeptide N-acetylgalactosaminyltransferase 5 [Indicator indicator]